ncbi:MAG TPA: hypothetical protein PKA53_04980 [Sphingobacterium sp.]|nr:hypothetical protein [Sphingobacterium sp.]
MKKYFLNIACCVLLIACGNKSTPPPPVFPDPKGPDGGEYFENEVKPTLSKPCFQGAYYRKVVSSVDNWVGIKGEFTLPIIQFDEDRKNPNKPGQYLDNPSVYMGGNMDGQETDIGLTWEVIRHANGDISTERLAFRPFLRRTGHKSGQQSLYQNAPAEAGYYWYPGEKVFMSLEIVGDGLLKFVIQGAGKSYETTFECAGYTLNRKGEFKRVNAIDQVSNEGKPAQATKASVSNSKWLYTTLIRMEKGGKVDAPMHTGRYSPMACPLVKHFSLIQSDEEKKVGAETINISGAGY